MITKNIKKIFAMLAIGVFALFSMITPVYADDYSHKGGTIGISPVKQKVSLKEGGEFTGSFKVRNTGDSKFKYRVYTTPYQVQDKYYTADFTNEGTYTQLSKWVELDKTGGELDVNEEDTITYTIKVPSSNVPSGGQYAAIMAEIDNSEQTNVQTSSRVAYMLYANIAGETHEAGSIKENGINSIVFGGGKITATSLVENTGNIDLDATYTFKIFPLGSSEEIYTNEDDPTVRVVLPETERYNTMTWEETPQLGIYTVEQVIEYAGQTSTTSKLVLVCPIWLIVIFAALIFAIIFTVVSRARARKQGSRGGSKQRSDSSTKREKGDKESEE